MDELWMLARRQLGLFTRAQALQLVSKSALDRLVANGHLRRFRRGVWVTAGAPASYEQAVLGALLAAGVDAWASHRTAARLWRLDVPPPEDIDVLTLPNRRLHLAGVAQHRNQLLVPADLTRVGPLPVTSVARTLLDCSPWLPGRTLLRAVDDARRRRLLRDDDLQAAHRTVDEGPRTGRHLVRPMRRVLADLHEAGGSDAELDVLFTLRRAGLPLPVQQYPIVVAGRQRYLDFAYPDRKIYLEFKGFSQHGLLRSVFDDDGDREGELALLGWLGLPFTSTSTDEDVVSRVARALQLRAA
jgi:hypothetical protein